MLHYLNFIKVFSIYSDRVISYSIVVDIKMGLSATQARLLTITSRQSDCEFRSMQLSQQNLTLARNLQILSDEYENSLGHTKLVYDFYGTSTGASQASYDLFMTPSGLNDYWPITITNSKKAVVLDSKYANAARNAGIPLEGLSCVPSTLVRLKFAEGLLNEKLIDKAIFSAIENSTYNQESGLGSVSSLADSSSEARMVSFYDTLLNQICVNGWTENNEVTDSEYLQDMIQSNMMFVTYLGNNNYYNQYDYSTFSYIREISDEKAVTEAETNYNIEKEKLDAKENILDLKIKNLSTEMEALTTEYDTVKNLISKNIEKGFKRYSA